MARRRSSPPRSGGRSSSGTAGSRRPPLPDSALLAASVVADDLTGAADAALGFHTAGFVVDVRWGPRAVSIPLEALRTGAAQVLAVDAGTRALSAARAADETTRVVAAVGQASRVVFKKIDSLLRGHAGEETRAALDARGAGALAIVAPAFPAAGRTTIRGRQRVNGVDLPGPDLPAILSSAGLPARLFDIRAVRDGDFASAVATWNGAGSVAFVCDAETVDDLRAVVRAGRRSATRVLWVGTAGLAAAVATAEAEASRSGSRAEIRPIHARGPVLVVMGTAHPAGREQAEAVVAERAAEPVIVPASALDGADAASARACAARIESLLAAGRNAIVTIDGSARAGDDSRLAAALGALLAPCARLVGGAVLTGGDTARAVLDRWGVDGLRILDEVEPGVPLSLTCGATAVPVVTKAGAFGAPRTIVAAIAALAADARHSANSSAKDC